MSDQKTDAAAGSGYAGPACSAWLAGWYATKLHAVVDGATVIPDQSIKSVCGAWVYREPRTDWAAKNIRRGLSRCKHCERILSQNKSATCGGPAAGPT